MDRRIFALRLAWFLLLHMIVACLDAGLLYLRGIFVPLNPLDVGRRLL